MQRQRGTTTRTLPWVLAASALLAAAPPAAAFLARAPTGRTRASGALGLLAVSKGERLRQDAEISAAARLLRAESVRRPGEDGKLEPREGALPVTIGTGRRLRPLPPRAGSLRLTRSDIEGSLACADKNLCVFQKQTTFRDCGLELLDRLGAGASRVNVDIAVQRMTGSEFFLSADLAGSLRCECDRCLEPFDQAWDAHFSLVLAARRQLTELARRRADEEDDQSVLRQKRTVDEAIVDFSAGVKYVDLKDDIR